MKSANRQCGKIGRETLPSKQRWKEIKAQNKNNHKKRMKDEELKQTMREDRQRNPPLQAKMERKQSTKQK